MNEQVTATAQRRLDAADEGTMDFLAIIRTLIEAGLEGYDVDYRRPTR
jgi:hypothetical protein